MAALRHKRRDAFGGGDLVLGKQGLAAQLSLLTEQGVVPLLWVFGVGD
jgi:hypothetical protein